FAGRNILKRLNIFKTHSVLFRKILGLIVIITVCLMIYNNSMSSPFGSRSHAATIDSHPEYTPGAPLLNPLLRPYPAPEIAGITDWINSSPLTIASLKGEVVLIDFWAYSCINCIRTLPYLNSWYEKYHDKGLEIIGVHSPEFDFERDLKNVQAAVTKDQIKYPVALDNRFATWNNYHNSYWPAHYLIDKNGNVVYEKFGEGDYEVTENNIRFLLGMNKEVPMSTAPATASIMQTPETYLGYSRADSFVRFQDLQHDIAAQYTYPSTLPVNSWALEGNWTVLPEKISATSANAKIKIHFHAAKIFAVMGQHAGKVINVEVRLDGVLQKTVQVGDDTLYTLLELPAPQAGVLELTVIEPGLELYTFTFGS
ncbi:MAG: thioredoxin family protein, partial [Gammaproteobacteria bacterium]